MIVAVDPASRKAGIALFSSEGKVIDTWQLVTDESTWGARLCDLSIQFAELPIPHEEVTHVVCEHVKGSSHSASLNSIAGIFWQYLPLVNLTPTSFVVPSSWKAFIRKKTGEKDPKGMTSLRRYGYLGEDVSEDEADAIMLGLCYFNKRK